MFFNQGDLFSIKCCYMLCCYKGPAKKKKKLKKSLNTVTNFKIN